MKIGRQGAHQEPVTRDARGTNNAEGSCNRGGPQEACTSTSIIRVIIRLICGRIARGLHQAKVVPHNSGQVVDNDKDAI